ncbi:hypothetical protein [Eikenella sp. NML03-A-027]|uniref:hypothetical protein n=1 Tax=Eikenella sp. NML03-A-027 TaxID=1795828 RepID=UPI000A8A6CA9|nr:hypothetical protein [Eikenella sp. NML03-A-027]
MKTFLAALLTAASLSAQAADYFLPHIEAEARQTSAPRPMPTAESSPGWITAAHNAKSSAGRAIGTTSA